MTPKATRLSACLISIAALFLPALQASADEAADAQAVRTAVDAAVPDTDADSQATAPSVEWPLKRLYCVQYARLRSGLALFGDARTWWAKARHLYEEFAQPTVDAVMVFSGSKRIRRGHVAIVTAVISPREIVVDHANWQNKGEIDHNMPVLDVSPANDWSQVRVWDMNSARYGAHVYRVSGFIGQSAKVALAGS
ncbi:MAG: CHAP domain-containing protein [Alphaproteobacteria bacterium]|nr:CHAP domain-containing protein [Alphaproteobacteria bacterium]MBV9692902.1 CHAP domain-containing protein [Alphaproteobacteria bacterium]